MGGAKIPLVEVGATGKRGRAEVVGWLKHFIHCPREMVLREEVTVVGLGQHDPEELPGHLVLQQPGLVLGKGRRVKGLIYDVQVQKPLEQQVILALRME
jgi:hypothetical protein